MNADAPVYRRSADVVFRRILDEYLLVPVRGRVADMQRVFALNAVGAAIWEALGERLDRDGLVARVVAGFAVDESTAAADVDRFLGDLQQAGLLEGPAAPTNQS